MPRKRKNAEPKNEVAQKGTQRGHSPSPAVLVYGDFPGRVMHVPTTLTSLLMIVGNLDDEKKTPVLVPYVEIKIGGEGENEDDVETLFSHVVTVENAAYMIFDMARDYKDVCQRLAGISKSEVRPLSSQIEQVSEYITRARSEIEECTAVLSKLIESLPKSA